MLAIDGKLLAGKWINFHEQFHEQFIFGSLIAYGW